MRAVEELTSLTLDLGGGDGGAARDRQARALRVPPIFWEAARFASEIPAGTEFELHSLRRQPAPHPHHTGVVEERRIRLVGGQPAQWRAQLVPCDDTPSEKATYDIIITADSPLPLFPMANWSPQGRRFHHSVALPHAPPHGHIPAAVQVGEFSSYSLGANTQAACLAFLRERVREEFSRQQEMVDFFSSIYGPIRSPPIRSSLPRMSWRFPRGPRLVHFRFQPCEGRSRLRAAHRASFPTSGLAIPLAFLRGRIFGSMRVCLAGGCGVSTGCVLRARGGALALQF
ncbi:hypothetical protein CACC_01435 [Corynebacterium accolens]|nr:hypothetical protein CACC_01435 [Corynebacterium accolens]